MALPLPGSPELRRLPINSEEREVYRVLYETRAAPLTMQGIRERLPELGDHEQLDRRRRELNKHFVIENIRAGREVRYRLIDAKPGVADDPGISEKDRAAVLSIGRCAFCGRTPLEDHVRLQVDHKIPRDWGGNSELPNPQPLCEECNRGKKAHFASYNEHAAEIRRAISYESVHQRIGELLKAFDGKEVRSDLIAVVASPPGTYQEDWQKRLRELRVLGWDIATTKKTENARVWAHYKLRESKPWPDGNIRQEITRLEKLRGYGRKSP
jgi:5-methylcytosine-specific restriction endonuclease McrA